MPTSILKSNTVEVLAGTYRENVVVNKTLTLRGLGLPVVDALGNGSAITIKADGIVLEGFVATNSSGYIFRGMPDRFGGAGILVFSKNNTIQDNVASSNSGCGIIIHWASGNNTMIGNNVGDNLGGSHNNLTSNIVSNNSKVGIYFDEAQNNVLEGNTVCNNSGGIILAMSDNNTLRRNLIFGNKENLADFGRNNIVDASNLIEGAIADNVDRLIQDLKDNNTSVRAEAAEALGDIGDRRAVKPLIKALNDTDIDRVMIIDALEKINDIGAVEPLIIVLKDDDWYIRMCSPETFDFIYPSMGHGKEE